jgi:fatty-acyl-CoA synthase
LVIISHARTVLPDKLAFIDAGKSPEWRLTFRDANRRANKLANWLKSQGIGKGDRVAILAKMAMNILTSSSPAQTRRDPHRAQLALHWQELLEIFQYTNPKILIFSDDFKDNVAN